MLQVYNRKIKYLRNLISRGSKTTFYHKKFSYQTTFSKGTFFNLHAFFVSNTFISNARLQLAKNQANAKQNPEVEILLFENYSGFSSTLSSRYNKTYP